MKVILLQDVARVGKRYEVANVPDGHALNMLIPKKMAEPATPENLKRLQARQSKIAADQTAAHANFSEVASALEGKTHVLAVEANEQGHLFQGLKAEHVAESLTLAGSAVSHDKIELVEPIKEVGEHELTLTDGEKTVKFTLKVEAK